MFDVRARRDDNAAIVLDSAGCTARVAQVAQSPRPPQWADVANSPFIADPDVLTYCKDADCCEWSDVSPEESLPIMDGYLRDLLPQDRAQLFPGELHPALFRFRVPIAMAADADDSLQTVDYLFLYGRPINHRDTRKLGIPHRLH